MSTITGALALAAGVVLLLSGCQSNGESTSEVETTSGEAAATGTLTVTAIDPNGKPVAEVEIEIERALGCDLVGKVITPGTSYTDYFIDATDDAGTAAFTALPLGCYHVSAKEADDVEVDAGSPSVAFLTESEPAQQLELRFGQKGTRDATECDPAQISEDLDIPEEQKQATATVVECDSNWSVIRWDTPGDSQRVVRYFRDKWVTYVVFPHDRCWRQARHDGAPRSFEQYFQPC